MAYGLKVISSKGDEILYTSRPITIALSALIWKYGTYVVDIPRPATSVIYTSSSYPGYFAEDANFDYVLGKEVDKYYYLMMPKIQKVEGNKMTITVEKAPVHNFDDYGWKVWSFYVFARKI